MNVSCITSYFPLSRQLLDQSNIKIVFMDLAILLFNQLFPETPIAENLNHAVKMSAMKSIWSYFDTCSDQKADPSVMVSSGIYNLCSEDTFWSEILISEDDLLYYELPNEDFWIDAGTLLFSVCSLGDTTPREPYCTGNCDQCSYFTESCGCDIFDIACIELRAIKDTGTAHNTPVGSLIETAYKNLLDMVFSEYNEFEDALGSAITHALSFDYLINVGICCIDSYSEAGIFAFPKGKKIFSFLTEHKNDEKWKYYYSLLELLLCGSCISEEREVFRIDYWFYDDVFCFSYALSEKDSFGDACIPICILMLYNLFEYVQHYLEQTVPTAEEKGV